MNSNLCKPRWTRGHEASSPRRRMFTFHSDSSDEHPWAYILLRATEQGIIWSDLLTRTSFRCLPKQITVTWIFTGPPLLSLGSRLPGFMLCCFLCLESEPTGFLLQRLLMRENQIKPECITHYTHSLTGWTWLCCWHTFQSLTLGGSSTFTTSVFVINMLKSIHYIPPSLPKCCNHLIQSAFTVIWTKKCLDVCLLLNINTFFFFFHAVL